MVNDEDRRLFVQIADKDDHDEEIMAGFHFTWEVGQITAYREAAEQRGREQERAAIVAWLRKKTWHAWCVERQVADAIEAEEHLT